MVENGPLPPGGWLVGTRGRMNLPMRGFRERREAQALQDALERYERALARGRRRWSGPRRRRPRTSASTRRPFVLATSMADARPPRSARPRLRAPRRDAAPRRSGRAAARCRAVRLRASRLRATRRGRRGLWSAALVLIPSFGALPGEPLYAVKGAAEDAASGSRPARRSAGPPRPSPTSASKRSSS